MSKVSLFGKELRRLRTSKAMTINDLSDKSSVSSSYISQIENGKRDTPQPDTIKKIALGLDVDYFSLMRIAGHMDSEEKGQFNASEMLMAIPIDVKTQFIVNNLNEEIRSSPELEKDRAKLELDLNARLSDEENVHQEFLSFMTNSGNAGHFLKVLRIYRNIDIELIANHLNMESKTYASLEDKLKKDSTFLKDNADKLGEILGVGNFNSWYKTTLKPSLRGMRFGALYESEIMEISFRVNSVSKKTDANGIDYYESYTYEELERNFFNLHNVLNQKEYDVLYKNKVLSKAQIEKVKTMLKIILEDDWREVKTNGTLP